jgi:hypothetical protein
VSVSGNITTQVWPACFADLNGQVFLRGHVTLSPVPAVGGAVLGLLPEDAAGVCVCTPKPDPGTRGNTVLATTTALAYPRDNPNVPDVCIVRLLISQYLPPDVNGDFVVNFTDLSLIYGSTYYSMDPLAGSKCPLVGTINVCGPIDVNMDGKVNQLDATSITQSLYLGSNVTCGGVYATAFSCGSTRSAPLTPAVAISLDSIVWFSDDGLLGRVNLLLNVQSKRFAKRDDLLVYEILAQVESLQHHFEQVDSKLGQVDSQLGQVDNKLGQHDSKFGQHDSKFGQVDSKLGQHDNKLGDVEKKIRITGPEILSEVVVSVVVMLVTALLFAAARKIRATSE